MDHRSRTVGRAVLGAVITAGLMVSVADAANSESATEMSLKQYASGGHVLGFAGGGYYVSSEVNVCHEFL